MASRLGNFKKVTLGPLSREELAWAAGFFDGEGYAGVNKRSHGKYLRSVITVAQNNLPVLQRFQAAVGGLGNINVTGPNGNGTQWQWRASGTHQLQAVAAMLWHWLSEPKRQQIRGVLLFHGTYHERMKLVSRQGGKGTPRSPETRAKISAARKLYWSRRRGES
jgi:hypothetical protein